MYSRQVTAARQYQAVYTTMVTNNTLHLRSNFIYVLYYISCEGLSGPLVLRVPQRFNPGRVIPKSMAHPAWHTASRIGLATTLAIVLVGLYVMSSQEMYCAHSTENYPTVDQYLITTETPNSRHQ